MDHRSSPSYRIAEFLGSVRRSESAGYRAAGDGVTASRIELHYRAHADGPQRMMGLRAELRDGAPVIVLYEQSELAPAPWSDAASWPSGTDGRSTDASD
jgi:sirohydrochlorin ferrochelatase